ncbi:lysozyme inhibitor LprI family protein [Caulobacter segnis]
MKLLPLTLAAWLILPVSGHSAGQVADVEKQYSPEYARCLRTGEAAKGVSVAMAACVNAEYSKQDQRLNAAYAAAMAKRSPQAREALRVEQRAWIKRRDASCEESLSGGTIDMVERPSCRMEMTVRRTLEFEGAARPAKAGLAPSADVSEARVFPHDAGVVDLLVIGPAARTLYDRLPGRGVANACGATGLHKGDGKISCTKVDADYSCHVWLDAPKQSLADPQEDDC